jgi:2'-5' RNA ligase
VRLFFALWPDDATRAALAALLRTLHEQCGGRRVQEHNIHLTLAFLGDVRADLVPGLLRMAGEMQGAPVDLALNTAEYWRHNRVVCAGTKLCPPVLRDLSARLGEGARGLGIGTEARDYVPHITLLRKAERAPAQRDFSEIEWHVSEFVLMRSVPRRDMVVYETIGRWALAAPG